MDDFFTARELAQALSVNKKRVQRLAAREHWTTRRNGNHLEYCPPPEVAARAAALKAEPDPAPTVRFADLAHSDTARQTTLLREQAVQLLESNLDIGKEAALQAVCSQMRKDHPMFRISVSSLRRWQTLYQLFGLDGLVEQKRGRVGRKPYAKDLANEEILRARADAVEHGIRGRTNIARAYRNLVASPTLSASARQWAHGEAASKSYVPPSVRDALRVPPLATTLIQVGPKAAKLDGPYTECTYDSLRPGDAFTADDMTANVYVWTEWPNEQGFLLIRPQILAAMDVATMRWLALRAIIRPKG